MGFINWLTTKALPTIGFAGSVAMPIVMMAFAKKSADENEKIYNANMALISVQNENALVENEIKKVQRAQYAVNVKQLYDSGDISDDQLAFTAAKGEAGDFSLTEFIMNIPTMKNKK